MRSKITDRAMTRFPRFDAFEISMIAIGVVLIFAIAMVF